MGTRWDGPTFGVIALAILVAGANLAGVRRADKAAAAGSRPLFPLAAAVLAL